MSVPDSRKSFLAKLTLCGLAALSAPALFWRRATATRAGTDGDDNRSDSGSAAPITLKPDSRAIPRGSVDA